MQDRQVGPDHTADSSGELLLYVFCILNQHVSLSLCKSILNIKLYLSNKSVTPDLNINWYLYNKSVRHDTSCVKITTQIYFPMLTGNLWRCGQDYDTEVRSQGQGLDARQEGPHVSWFSFLDFLFSTSLHRERVQRQRRKRKKNLPLQPDNWEEFKAGVAKETWMLKADDGTLFLRFTGECRFL